MAVSALTSSLPASTDARGLPAPFALRSLAVAGATALGGTLILRQFPTLELAVFARGAAALAGLFTGTAPLRIPVGWLLPYSDVPVAVTAACSATDFYLILAALLAWQFSRRGHHPARVLPLSLLGALPLALGVNALRIVAVTQAHRWFIPLLPDSYAAFLHLLTGTAIFLPALILLNLALESHAYARRRAPLRASPPDHP